MPTTSIDVQELAARLDEILKLANAGTEVIVTAGNVPRAKLLPLGDKAPRVAGLNAGAWTIADDFDDPLPDDFWSRAASDTLLFLGIGK